MPRYDETLPTIYTREQIADILKGAGPYMRLVIGLALECGLREQEIVHLEWPDIHLDDKVLRVSSKPHYEFRVKASEERDVPIPDDLLAEIKQWHKAHPNRGLLLATKGGNHQRRSEPILAPALLLFTRNCPPHLPHGSPPFGRAPDRIRSSWEIRPMKMSGGRYRRLAPQSRHAATIHASGKVSTGAGIFWRQPLQAMTKGWFQADGPWNMETVWALTAAGHRNAKPVLPGPHKV
ncbi:MAG TPA: site-specific integrase [Terracidiphilus sp.]|nr:site-specific integrase [Terracidiphilus sp.]